MFMNRRKAAAMYLCAGLMAAGMTMGASAEETAESAVEMTTEAATEAATENAAEADSSQLTVPTDFTVDPNTGEFSFQTTDERVGYYFVRVYHVDENGNESGEYAASSKRINGGSTGEVSGTIDVSQMPWGTYHINLVSFAPAGTDYENPEVVTLSVQYGIDVTFERPELMIFTSGNQAELIVDWYTLANYSSFAYLPNMKFTFYADEACTQEVFSDTVDLAELPNGNGYEYIPPANGYVWGWKPEDGQHLYHIVSEGDFGSTDMNIGFRNDVYTYQLDAGTYYVTAQACSKDEYCGDSKASEVLTITLTDEESTETYETLKTSLWVDPVYGMERMYAGAGTQDGRTDYMGAQDAAGQIIE